jgi:phosphate transport system substrate-binding protein
MRYITTLLLIGLSTFVSSLLTTAAHAQPRVQGAGATFPNPLYQKWVITYTKANPGVQFDYQSIGSGGGIKGLTDKSIDFAGSDAPMSKREREAAGSPVVHLPMTIGAVVPAFNLPGVTDELRLSGPVIADIYVGAITNWSDKRIADLNPGLKLPDLRIVPVFRTDGSGTTFVFTNYLATQSEKFKETIGMGKAVSWPVGQGGKGNEGVAAAVQQTAGSLGYIELNYAVANKIAFAAVQNAAGKFIKASPESVTAASTAAAPEITGEPIAALWNRPGEATYPIAAFSYMIVYQDLAYLRDPTKARALVGFLTWAATTGQDSSSELDYAPLSPAIKDKVLAAIASLTFDGKPVN